MNCRRINGLLSAYIDRELTGTDMLEVRQHLRDCPVCQLEHQSLHDTKRLLNCLAQRLPRPELESLLLAKAARAENPVRRWLPRWLSEMGEAIRPLPMPRLTPALGAAVAAMGLVIISLPLDRNNRRAVENTIFVPVSAAPQIRYGVRQREAITFSPSSAVTPVGLASPQYGEGISPTVLETSAAPQPDPIEQNGDRVVMVLDAKTGILRFFRLRPTPPPAPTDISLLRFQ